MIDWNEIRKQFPAAEKYIYLNSASESIISKKCAEIGKNYYDTVLNSVINWDDWCKKIDLARKRVADLLNADIDEIAFIPNTSFGMNFIAQILKDSGEVVTMDDEFTATTYPFINQGFKLNFVRPVNNIYTINEINNQVNEKTKILLTSHVQSFTGFKADLIELGNYCKEKNLIFVVNATQSIGVIPIDVKKANIDFLVFSSVKWLNTCEGIGAIYINKKYLDKIKFPFVGWMSVKNIYNFDNKNLNLKNNASVLELGAMCLHSIFVMDEAIKFNTKIGINNIQIRLEYLTDYLIEKLNSLNLDLEIITPIDKKYRSSIIVFKIPNSKQIVSLLEKQNIIVSERLNKIRVSLNIFNNTFDIDKFVDSLEYITKTINYSSNQ